MGELRALVIDDSRQVRQFIIDYVLAPQGFSVDYAVNGLEGLKKALAILPDIILMDYEMPKMNGLQVLRSLRNRHHSKIPVILMTSHGSEQIAIEVFRLGIHDYIIKPFKPQEMLDAIENALAVTHLQRDKEDLTRRVMEANRQLSQHLEELNALYEVGKSITALIQPTKLLERIVDAVLTVTDGDECALLLTDSKSGKVKNHFRKERDRQHQHPGHTRQLEEELPSVESDTVTLKPSVLSVPLQVGKRVLGILSVQKNVPSDNKNDQQQPFTAHDERLLRMLADYGAIAIQNMQLVRQIQRTKEQEKQQIRNVFERYMAPSVVKQILDKPEQVSLGGTRKTMSILFADVRGFSTFSAHTSPEILIELLNRYMYVAVNAILEQEGTLDKFMGDAVMAFFNAPLPQYDHPIRSVRAAWQMTQSIKELHRRLPTAYHWQFGIGVGLGDAVVGNVGTAQLMNYTVIGDSVNKVKRLQENAEGGQILISQVTYHMVQEYIQARPLGNIHLKGQPHPELVYEVLEVD